VTSNPVAYPAHREADVALRDGSTVQVRPARPSDRESVLDFLRGLSRDSLFFRFFSGGANLEAAADWATDVDYEHRFGLIATSGVGHGIVGHAGYQVTDGDRAEVAFEVADDFQGRGLGTILLVHLAEAAEEQGVAIFEASVLPENFRMAGVFRESGFSVRMRSAPDLISVEMPTTISAAARERFEERERTTAVAAVRRFLEPASVAVIGASRRRGTVGGEVFHNLLATGFNGPVHPVNPQADVVQSVRAFKSVLDVTGDVELAIVAVPAAAVIDAARECAAKGVKALVVLSAGFAETGAEGAARQHELVRICREGGMRLVGPNCLGVLNTASNVRLNGIFGPLYPPSGGIGFLSQSGALGLAIVDYAAKLDLGLSSFVSVGNKADISGNDLIQYWEADESTELMLLYLESFGNPRKFGRIARRVARTKPILAVKSGRSAAGARAASSHTGALLASSDVTVDSLFGQAGVVRTDTLAELFDVATLLASQPVPSGRRVAIVTNAGGPGIMCADACEARGLEVVPLADDVRAELATFLPPAAALANPVDMIATAPAEHYRRAVSVVGRHQAADAIIAIFIPPLLTESAEVAAAIREGIGEIDAPVPLLAVFMTAEGPPADLSTEEETVPAFAFPEDAARALARAADNGVWRSTPAGETPIFEDARVEEGAAVIAGALARRQAWLEQEDVARLLSCYGIRQPESQVVETAEEAGRAAAQFGGRIALKAITPTLLHKTEAGGVELSLDGAAATMAAAARMARRVTEAGHPPPGFLIQQMVPSGVEMLVGVVHDPLFGPVVACGAGGVQAELLKDVAARISPLTDRDAREMIRSLKTFSLLDGFRGAPKADVGALEDVVLRVGALVENHPEIAEMDCNPVTVSRDGAVVVDARIRVQEAVPPRPEPALRVT
jgi:acetyl coenzyme A synthetase (ADP forming)-like protein